MNKIYYSLLLFLLILVSCGGSETMPGAAPVANAQPSGDTLNPGAPLPSGDLPTSSGPVAQGEVVNVVACKTDSGASFRREEKTDIIGAVGIFEDQLKGFSIGGEETKGANKYSVTILTGSLPLAPGKYSFPGVTAPSFAITNSTLNKPYLGMNYILFYETDPVNAPTTWDINLRLVEKLPSDAFRGAVRLHIAGDLQAYLAYAPMQLSDACLNEKLARSTRYPIYNAAICGAEKVKLECTFDVTGNVPYYTK